MKIAICTAHYGDVTAQYASSLARMVALTAQTQINFNGNVLLPTIELFMKSSSLLPWVRSELTRDALAWEANYQLWVDADQQFPADALLRLLELNLPVVGANYPRRAPPHLPTATALDGTPLITTEKLAREGAVVQVRSLGFGLCLIDTMIFRRLQQTALEHGEDGMWPLFEMSMTPDGSDIVGEDIYFAARLARSGIPIHVDHTISWVTGHVHQQVLTHFKVSL